MHVLGEHNGTKTELYRTNAKSQGLVPVINKYVQKAGEPENDAGFLKVIIIDQFSRKTLKFGCPLMNGNVMAGVHSSAILVGICIAFYGNVMPDTVRYLYSRFY